MPRKRRKLKQGTGAEVGGPRAVPPTLTGHDSQECGLLVGPGSSHYDETDTILHAGYLHPTTWHCLARHYQKLDHTPTMIVATITQRLSTSTTTMATKAVHIITGKRGNPIGEDGCFKPRSILEYLTAAHLTDAHLAAVAAQIVRVDGRITLLP